MQRTIFGCRSLLITCTYSMKCATCRFLNPLIFTYFFKATYCPSQLAKNTCPYPPLPMVLMIYISYLGIINFKYMPLLLIILYILSNLLVNYFALSFWLSFFSIVFSICFFLVLATSFILGHLQMKLMKKNQSQYQFNFGYDSNYVHQSLISQLPEPNSILSWTNALPIF